MALVLHTVLVSCSIIQLYCVCPDDHIPHSGRGREGWGGVGWVDKLYFHITFNPTKCCNSCPKVVGNANFRYVNKRKQFHGCYGNNDAANWLLIIFNLI